MTFVCLHIDDDAKSSLRAAGIIVDAIVIGSARLGPFPPFSFLGAARSFPFFPFSSIPDIYETYRIFSILEYIINILYSIIMSIAYIPTTVGQRVLSFNVPKRYLGV